MDALLSWEVRSGSRAGGSRWWVQLDRSHIFWKKSRQSLSRLSVFVSYPRSSHVEMWVRFENACPKFWVSLPWSTGGPKSTSFRRFSRLCNIIPTWTASIFGRKQDRQSRNAVVTANGLLYTSHNSTNFGPQTPKNRTGAFIHPP